MAKLTTNQQRFCDFYIELGNATDAYIKAGYKVKSTNVAKVNASRLLTNANIQQYIEERMQQLEDASIAKQTEILQTLTKILRRETPDFETVVVKKAETIEVTGANGKTYEKVVYSEYAETIPVKTQVKDVNKAAELLGKRYAMWTDRQEVEVIEPVFVDNVPEED
jgi:phage terminase small subunit